jgi:hypothetical protein
LASKSTTPEMVSQRVNRQLTMIDFSTLSVKQGARRLVKLLLGEAVDGDDEQVGENTNESLLKAGTRLEVALAESGKRRMKRLQLLTLMDE